MEENNDSVDVLYHGGRLNIRNLYPDGEEELLSNGVPTIQLIIMQENVRRITRVEKNQNVYNKK